MERSALLGLHGKRDLRISLKGMFQKAGYTIIDITQDPEEMIKYVRTRDYARYLMDLNLGSSNSPDITPAISVYELIRQRVDSGEAKFVGISGNNDAVKSAKERGIPAFPSLVYFSLDDFIV